MRGGNVVLYLRVDEKRYGHYNGCVRLEGLLCETEAGYLIKVFASLNWRNIVHSHSGYRFFGSVLSSVEDELLCTWSNGYVALLWRK